MSYSDDDVFRKTILKRLNDLQDEEKSMSNFINSYSRLANDLTEKKAEIEEEKRKIEEASILSAMDLAKLKEEISELYVSKSEIDQRLIEVNQMQQNVDQQKEIVKKDKLALEQEHKNLCGIYAQLGVELQKLRFDSTTIKDEQLALSTTCMSLKNRIAGILKERVILSNKIRELQDYEMDFLPELTPRKKDRSRSGSLKTTEIIEKAIADTSRDKKIEETLKKLPEEANQGGYMADVIPSSMKVTFSCDEGEVNDVHWLSATEFVTAGADRKVRIWNMDYTHQATKINSFTGCNAAITRLDYNVDAKHLLASCNDKNIRVWNTNRILATLSGHADQVTCAKFYQSHHIISGSADRIIKIWDLSSQRCSRSFYPEKKVMDIVSCIGLNHQVFASGHFDKTVRIWDGRSSDPIKSFELGGRVTSLDVTLDGNEILCSSRDDTLSLLDIRNCSVLHLYSSESYRTSSDYTRCVISPGGDYVAAGSSTGVLFVWNLKTTKLAKRIQGKSQTPILSVAWNPSGTGILAASKQKIVSYFN